MSDMTRVALDAMGGDNAPVEMVKRRCRSSTKAERYSGSAHRKRRDIEGRTCKVYISG